MQFPGQLIAFGSSGESVKEIQRKLGSLGFYEDVIDGIFGENMKTGVIRFQRKNGLNPDGIVGKLTWDKLFNNTGTSKDYPGYLIGVGTADQNVKLIQQQLNALGYNTGTPDGIFGNGTKNAVINFQKDNFLSQDGIVGELTWNVLFFNTVEGNELTYPGQLFSVGSSGENVKRIQNQLNRLGFNVGVADGIFGNGTKQGVMNFQTSRNITADGIVGKQTWDLLMNGSYSENNTTYPGVLLAFGSSGDLVRTVQTQLNSLNYPVGVVDGVFGNNTKQAVIEFQRVHGLQQDGIVGRLTWDILFGNTTTTIGIPFPGVLLGIGSSGEDVKRVQQRLNNLGFNAGTADGIYGTKTKSAVEGFQRLKMLDVDGIVGKLTWNALFSGVKVSNPSIGDTYPGVLIAYGSSGENVRKVQSKLVTLGYLSGSVDGIFGNNTKQAVMAFQHDSGLQADGIVGRMTWNALFSTDSVSSDVPSDGGLGPINGVFKVFIDAGHGGYDPGAVTIGLTEKDTVLKISLYQKELFEAAGYTVKLSRSTDKYLSLKERTDMANAWGADLFISNHVNAGGGQGSEVWASLYDSRSRAYASRVAQNLSLIFRNRGVKTRQGSNGDYLHVIRESKMTAILVEHGFIDNSIDVMHLKSDSKLRAMALAIFQGINSLSPVPNDDKKVFNSKAGFSQLLGQKFDLTLPNPKVTKQILNTNRFTITLEEELVINPNGFPWEIPDEGFDTKDLTKALSEVVIKEVAKQLYTSEDKLSLFMNVDELKNERIEEVRVDIAKLEVDLFNPSLEVQHLVIELKIDTGYKGWKIKQKIIVNFKLDELTPTASAPNWELLKIGITVVAIAIVLTTAPGWVSLGAATAAIALVISTFNNIGLA